MTGHLAPSGRDFAEALPMPSAYVALILRGFGLSPRTQAELLEGTGLTQASLGTAPEITLGQQLRQIRNATRVLEPGWSLTVGARLSPETHGANGFAIATAPTLRHGIASMERFAHLRSPHFRMRAYPAGDEVRLVMEKTVALTEDEHRALVDLVMLSVQAMLESQLGRPTEEARFEFPWPAPEHAHLIAEHYHAPVHFDRPQTACVIPARWLAIESPYCDPTMHHALTERLHLADRRLHGDRLLVARVEQILAQRGARLGLPRAARLLGISERTLSRRLGGQGTSFQALVDNSQKSRAAALLHDEELTIAEVADALGYEDAANFGRAFRRWFGISPGKYRASVDGEDPFGGVLR
jgi:AraC-like DNA-binding protein